MTGMYVGTVGPTGNTIDLAQIYDEGVISVVTFNETLQLDSYLIRVRIHATNSTGKEHVESVQTAQSNATTGPRTTSTMSPDNMVRTNTPLPGVSLESSSQGLLGTLIEAVRNLVSAAATGESLGT